MRNQSSAVKEVEFNGDQIRVIEKQDQYYVAMKPICKALSLIWRKQYQRIAEDPVLKSVITVMVTTGSDGKQYKMFCLPLEYLNGWLFKINANRYQSDRREKIIHYQKECYLVLYQHFFNKTQPKSSSSYENYYTELRDLVVSWCHAAGIPFNEGWKRVYGAFNLDLKELHRASEEWMPEACEWVQKKIDQTQKSVTDRKRLIFVEQVLSMSEERMQDIKKLINNTTSDKDLKRFSNIFPILSDMYQQEARIIQRTLSMS